MARDKKSIARGPARWYNNGMESISEKSFGSAYGRSARLFTLESGEISVSVTDLGAAVTDIIVKDREGRPRNVVLGYGSAAGYAAGSSCVGALVGRYAGRIGGARFSLSGGEYRLIKNDGENHLHGGFSKRFFDAEAGEGLVRMSLVSPDGDEGFPGELRLSAAYSVVGNRLRIEYEAETDRETVLNITNHSYFNLDGQGDVLGHLLLVNADSFAELGAGLIPTGRLPGVRGTALDLTSPRMLGEVVHDPQLGAASGLDHSFALENRGELVSAAAVYSPLSGIGLICRTTQPSVHIYSGNFIHLDSAGAGRDGEAFLRYGGVCLETQHFPDSPNKPRFPSTRLAPGERFREVTEYEFVTVRG